MTSTPAATSARELLAGLLAADGLPAWQIVSDARELDTVRKPGAVVLWSARRARGELANGKAYLSDELVVWVLTATSDPRKIEDDLDGLLLAVVGVIEGAPSITWTDAERAVLDEKFTGWKLNATAFYTTNT